MGELRAEWALYGERGVGGMPSIAGLASAVPEAVVGALSMGARPRRREKARAGAEKAVRLQEDVEPVALESEALRWADRGNGTALLGVGSFAVVRLLEDRATGRERRACKVVPKRRVRHMEGDLKNEVLTWSVLSGSLDVVHFYAAFEDDLNVYLLLELCKGGELSQRLKGSTPLCEAEARGYMRTVLRLLCHMEALHICHRDLKPDNFSMLVSAADSPIKLGASSQSVQCVAATIEAVRAHEMLARSPVADRYPLILLQGILGLLPRCHRASPSCTCAVARPPIWRQRSGGAPTMDAATYGLQASWRSSS